MQSEKSIEQWSLSIITCTMQAGREIERERERTHNTGPIHTEWIKLLSLSLSFSSVISALVCSLFPSYNQVTLSPTLGHASGLSNDQCMDYSGPLLPHLQSRSKSEREKTNSTHLNEWRKKRKRKKERERERKKKELKTNTQERRDTKLGEVITAN